MKMFIKCLTICITTLLIARCAFAQDSTASKWEVGGYINDMQIVAFKKIDEMLATNLIHNRINIQWFPNDALSFHAGMRNRILFGNPVLILPGLGYQLDAGSDQMLVDLSKSWINRSSFVVNTTIDRLWADWSHGKWDIRIGRQRVNWGKTLVWNSNDWFNTFNYTDFDYPERPGSDAIRIRYFPTGMSVVDLAVSPGKSWDQAVAAIRYGFHQWNYDFQVLGGIYHENAALGVGWSGNIKSLAFRGEASWFQPYKHFSDSSGSLSATISLDYLAPDSWYFQVAALYNTVKDKPANTRELFMDFIGHVSARRLMPVAWSFFGQISRDITPLWHVDVSAISGFDPMLLFLMPGTSYSLTQNFEVSAIAQIFAGKEKSGLENLGNGVYIRFKYNF